MCFNQDLFVMTNVFIPLQNVVIPFKAVRKKKGLDLVLGHGHSAQILILAKPTTHLAWLHNNNCYDSRRDFLPQTRIWLLRNHVKCVAGLSILG